MGVTSPDAAGEARRQHGTRGMLGDHRAHPATRTAAAPASSPRGCSGGSLEECQQ
ncbi:hypothetical protein [Microbacterium sp. W4I4]|uniref:hypothetical protein n=1 Tax=Microbacterium sp. W4I4 TaxID=3042295 RepID=UPI0027D77C8B|nr:hypothetical protein [Microbacterium sp. W4I4]